jgi:hypothetical protein
MIYLYGLLSPDTEGTSALAAGLDGVTGPVQLEPLPQGHLIYGHHDGSEILAKRRFLLAHARVLERFLEAGTVLPMRFGMMAADLGEVARMLVGQETDIADQLTRLKGLVEFGVRVSYDRSRALAHQLDRHEALALERAQLLARGSGHHFEQAEFGRRLADALDRHRTDAQHTVVKALKEHVVDMVIRAPEEDVQVLAADLLVPKGSEADLERTLTNVLTATDFGGGGAPQIRLIGPEPPYNFVRMTLTEPAEAA